jgi:hypothetical protein
MGEGVGVGVGEGVGVGMGVGVETCYLSAGNGDRDACGGDYTLRAE